MATYLYRIGKFAYRRKGAVLSVWLIILVLMGVRGSDSVRPHQGLVLHSGNPGAAGARPDGGAFSRRAQSNGFAERADT